MRLKSILRYVRMLAGVPPSDTLECSAYLRYIAMGRLSVPDTLDLGWGRFRYTNFGSTRSQYEEIFVKRHYAFRAKSPEPVIIDCGGNVGLSAIWFRKNYPNCFLTVYEADPILADILKSNLSVAGDVRTVVHNNAVWVEDKDVEFSQTGVDTGRIESGGNCKVRAIDFAAHLPPKVHLLKMDIEGAEFEVIEHLLQTGAIDKIENIAAEFHPSRATFQRMLDIFKAVEASGMNVSMEVALGPYVGLEAVSSSFDIVGRNRMFVQAYLWRGAGLLGGDIATS